jgi:transcriptional regulator with XRE-family HTH domain
MDDRLCTFLKELMERRHRLPSQMAADLGVSHATVSRWLSGKDIPNPQSCRSLAEYASLPAEKILAIAGHLPQPKKTAPAEWPEFREYAKGKYPRELGDDLIVMVESLIEHRRRKRKREHR